MTKDQQKQYLEALIETEKTQFVQKRVLDKLDETIGSIGKPKEFAPLNEPQEPTQKTAKIWAAASALAAVATVISVLCGFDIIKFEGSAFMAKVSLYFLIITVCCIISVIKAYKEGKELAQREQRAFRRIKAERNRKVEEDEERVARETEMLPILCSEREKLAEKAAGTAEKLAGLYSADVVSQEYRNLPALCSAADYLADGSADDIAGACALFSEGVNNGILEGSVDSAIARIDIIEFDQNRLYRELNDSILLSERLMNDTLSYCAGESDNGSPIEEQNSIWAASEAAQHA